MDTQQPSEVTLVRRGAGGRFLPGTAGGPGRNSERAVALREAMLEELTPADLGELTRRLYDLAMGGDCRAADILLKRLLPAITTGSSVQVAIQNNTTNGRTLATTILQRMREEQPGTQDGEIL